jgi:hypothetical protein
VQYFTKTIAVYNVSLVGIIFHKVYTLIKNSEIFCFELQGCIDLHE